MKESEEILANVLATGFLKRLAAALGPSLRHEMKSRANRPSIFAGLAGPSDTFPIVINKKEAP